MRSEEAKERQRAWKYSRISLRIGNKIKDQVQIAGEDMKCSIYTAYCNFMCRS